MKPFRERNPVVIGAIGLIVLAGVVLAAFQLDRLSGLTGRAYQAAFRDASGLTPGNEVRVAGVRVGKVTGVELARGAQPYVRVRFRVDADDVRLGRETGATIRIKTVLGQKYLALTPAGPGRLREGEEIPTSRTASPFDVMQAVTGLADTIEQIDTGQLAAAFRTLSQTFADTPASAHSALDGLSRLSRTVAERDAELRTLLARARTVTDVLADRDEEFRKLVADGAALLAEVSRRRDAIHELLVGTNELATQLSGLVADNRAQLAPALKQLRDVVAILQRNRDDLERTLQRMGPFVSAFANVVGNGRWFDSYVSGLLQPYQPTTGGR
ncbi:phospholipid/cholesterol/gamma-HCH transport system substrate-binding protein [Micromonospora pattaloongensis]|uniref:Phospholipid/cholesterol/gamma-HCH transport system substrate-binding protein n=1 Tax=Micromonospora pattaloongensis TaxID=405436 RepID=A0A1H3RTX9_9ACTN|nr:MCE family protein [Micromonospora pattaloongensis]SDZ29164.1 phospholipid/cholesterol/gamma-HCH transport system substrate-binding protein [Micromonospora pattaloongensis]